MPDAESCFDLELPYVSVKALKICSVSHANIERENANWWKQNYEAVLLKWSLILSALPR